MRAREDVICPGQLRGKEKHGLFTVCLISSSFDFFDLENLAGMQIFLFLILLKINKKTKTKHHTVLLLPVRECGVVQTNHPLSRTPTFPAFQMFWARLGVGWKLLTVYTIFKIVFARKLVGSFRCVVCKVVKMLKHHLAKKAVAVT